MGHLEINDLWKCRLKEKGIMEKTDVKNAELQKIENEIITLKNQTAQNIIQIGYKLIEAK